MLDAKKKKKKGTLGVGNGSLFFASESDKVRAPARCWTVWLPMLPATGSSHTDLPES